MKNHKTLLTIILLISFINYGFAQKNKLLLADIEKAETIKAIGNIINENYIFPEVSDKIIHLINSKLKDGQYESIKDPNKFADILTSDIQSFNNDKHLRVLFEPNRIAKSEIAVSAEDSIRFEQEYILNLKRNNYYFKETKILEGNIGYLDLRQFEYPEYAGETAISAMSFLSNSDAIIIDLRNNGGGTPKMVQLLASYFFKNEAILLNSVYKRNENITKQFWTLPYVEGKRMPNVPLYILTSSRTFSAAEEFCYDLQSLKRAIIVGTTSGGGAHPGGRIKATDKYNVWTPTGRAINPITNTNWEGVGIKPNVKTPAKEALFMAHIKALDSLKNQSVDIESKKYYKWHLETVKAKKRPINIALSTLKTYTGNYGIRTIGIDDGKLYYQRKNSKKYVLIPMSKDTFIIEELSHFRIQFLFDNNKAMAIKDLKENGTSSIYNIDKN
jgi:hypothetical protein